MLNSEEREHENFTRHVVRSHRIANRPNANVANTRCCVRVGPAPPLPSTPVPRSLPTTYGTAAAGGWAPIVVGSVPDAQFLSPSPIVWDFLHLH